MREFLNSILSFIVAESLTDLEWASVTATIPIYDQASYNDLARILASREGVSNMQERLLGYYTARGVSITPANNSKSNILIGLPL